MSINLNKSVNIQGGRVFNLLLAEDDYANAEYVKIIFRRENINVLHALNGAEAVYLFKNNPMLDLVLMDIKMPIMDGYIATREIRKINGDIPIIAFTAFALDGDRENAIEAGCTDYVIKPVQKDKLISLVLSYLTKPPA